MRMIENTANVTNPGAEPVNGDSLLITYTDGTSDQVVFNSSDVLLTDSGGDTFIVTKSALFDRMDIEDKLDTIYAMEQQGLKATPPDTLLYKTLDNVRQREFIDLTDPRIRTTLTSLGLYTEVEINTILRPAEEYEIPITHR